MCITGLHPIYQTVIGVHGRREVTSMSEKTKEYYPSQLGYRSLNDRTNLSRKIVQAYSEYAEPIQKTNERIYIER